VGLLLLILPIIAIVAAVLLLRGVPRRRRIGLGLTIGAWTCVVFVAGHEVGRIPPQYRANITIQKLIRDTDRVLAAGDVEQVEDAYRDAQQSLVQEGGTADGAARLIAERLQPPSP